MLSKIVLFVKLFTCILFFSQNTFANSEITVKLLQEILMDKLMITLKVITTIMKQLTYTT